MSEDKNQQVTGQLKALVELVDNTNDGLRDLHERLSIVLLEEEDDEVAARKEVGTKSSVPLARDLQNVYHQVNNVLGGIENIKRKLSL